MIDTGALFSVLYFDQRGYIDKRLLKFRPVAKLGNWFALPWQVNYPDRNVAVNS